MTRLFIRFYIGVILILFVAWCVQAYLFRRYVSGENQHVAEKALGGGARVARELFASSKDDATAALKEVQKHFDYPVHLVSVTQLPQKVRDRFASPNTVVTYVDDGVFVAIPLSNETQALQLGPIPLPRGPSGTDMLVSMGALLIVVAVAIGVLLRPVSRQLRLLERTATAIAGGDFAARVDERRVSSARPLAVAMNDMAQRTETLLRTQAEMVQAVSHELRTPLSRITFAIDLLRSEKREEQREGRLNSLESAAMELDHLVGELLHYVRWENSQPQVNCEEIDLLSLVEAAIEKHSSAFASKHFCVGDALQRGDVVVHCDRLALERALGNLITNAGRFAKSKVNVEWSSSSRNDVIDVDDDGPGIPASDRDRVFDPFIRLDDSGRGTGLGLALVRRIVGHHGGTVCAQESPLGGCRIRITLPALP